MLSTVYKITARDVIKGSATTYCRSEAPVAVYPLHLLGTVLHPVFFFTTFLPPLPPPARDYSLLPGLYALIVIFYFRASDNVSWKVRYADSVLHVCFAAIRILRGKSTIRRMRRVIR